MKKRIKNKLLKKASGDMYPLVHQMDELQYENKGLAKAFRKGTEATLDFLGVVRKERLNEKDTCR